VCCLQLLRTVHCAKRRLQAGGSEIPSCQKWVCDLSSILCRDGGTNGRIRDRHLSISDFFVSGDYHCDYKVNLGEANVRLSISCKTMVDQLRLNICKLEDSRFASADAKDLQSLIEQNISDSSPLYWSNHLCFTTDNGDHCMWAILKEFIGGLHPLFRIEVLGFMGIVFIGAPSLRGVISWAKFSAAPARD
jgi:hypothetical protein